VKAIGQPEELLQLSRRSNFTIFRKIFCSLIVPLTSCLLSNEAKQLFPLSLSLSLSLPLTHTLCYPCILSYTYSFTLSLSHTHALTHTHYIVHTYTHYLFLPYILYVGTVLDNVPISLFT